MAEEKNAAVRRLVAKVIFNREVELFHALILSNRLRSDLQSDAKTVLTKAVTKAKRSLPRRIIFLADMLRAARKYLYIPKLMTQREFEMTMRRVNKSYSLRDEIGGILLAILSTTLAILCAQISILACVGCSIVALAGLSMFFVSRRNRCIQQEPAPVLRM